ncbi:MAG: MotA/TolQ/ExbB proton channel family protein [Prevotellaceae bacterium]|jgi:biopolymer transport protein ExbB|nr:MotA/TolQ/ExbB proton channel family protein [Prevotellaceae bacterium]
MNILSIILQVPAQVAIEPSVVDAAQQVALATGSGESYFDLLLKGGWILVPIVGLFVLSIFVIFERWVALSQLGKKDSALLARITDLISENKLDKASRFCSEQTNSYARVIGAGLGEAALQPAFAKEEKPIEDAMSSEARQQIVLLEKRMNYLGITASVAPMLGFLGTIFGVIKIFYSIALTGDLEIATIADGLYQKMICSGVGLFVGIIAYSGYYVLNGYIDKIVANLDKYSNETLKAIRNIKIMAQ